MGPVKNGKITEIKKFLKEEWEYNYQIKLKKNYQNTIQN